MKLNRRNMFMLLAGAALTLVLPAAPVTPPSTAMTIRRCSLQFRTLSDGTKEYRAVWEDGRIEPVTIEEWIERGKGHILKIYPSK